MSPSLPTCRVAAASSIAFVAALMLQTTSALAQESAPLVLSLPASTEAMSVGNVLPISRPDADGIFYNAASLSGARGAGLALQRFGSNSTLLTASASLPWLDGGIGIGAQSLSYDAEAGRAPVHGDLVSAGDVAVSELAASIGYAREFGDVRVGAVGKLIEQRVAANRGAAAGVDLGAAVDVAFFTLGFAVQNVGSDFGDDLEVEMPDHITLSGAFEPEPVGPLDVGAALAVSRRTDGEIIPAGGIDVRYWPIQGRTFIARVGLQRVPTGPAQPLTFGLAFWGDSLSLEYAFQSYERSSDTHRFGIRWRQ